MSIRTKTGVRVALIHTGSLLLLALVLTPASLRAGALEKELLRQAPKVLKHLKDKGYQNVGVLKFRVRKGSEPITDNAGTINLSLAEQLEMALILGNDVRQPVGIIHNASAVATRLRGATHLTREGRRKLFEGRYPLAWGNEEVSANAFLTGVVQISPDLREITVGILGFDRDSGGLEKVAQFTAAMDTDALVESGESFVLRGAFDEEPAAQAKAINTAARVKAKEEEFPLADATAVEMEIRYDGKKIPLELRDGKALVPEPREGQKVTFVLRRKVKDKIRYGVVLKVNGENTLFRQKLKELQCTKWLLDPGDPPITIQGFQLTGKTVQAFQVLARPQSKQAEMDYGADVGTIALVVYREKRGKEPPPDLLNPEAEDLAVLTRGSFPAKPPANLAALREQLRRDSTRGLIVQGKKTESAVQTFDFRPDPTPVLSATITYYRP